jgi:hypothetical protein
MTNDSGLPSAASWSNSCCAPSLSYPVSGTSLNSGDSGRSRVVGTVPLPANTAWLTEFRSMALLTAVRARTSSNGAIAVL